jgi:AraC family transcriptional regulator of arabinose operon
LHNHDVRFQVHPVDPPAEPLLWVTGLGHYHSAADYAHAHPRGTLDNLVFVTLGGSGRYRIGRRAFTDGPGRVTFMPVIDGAMDWRTGEAPWEFCWIALRGDQPLRWASQFGLDVPLVAAAIGDERARELARAFDRRISAGSPMTERDRMVFQRESFLLFHAVIDAVTSTTRPASEPQINGRGLISVLEDYLARPNPTPDRVQDLARRLGVRAEHVSRTMKELTGLPPKEHFMRHRIRQAEDLLRSTDLGMAEIGAQIGYPDPYHFSRLFRARTGMTPTAYRRRYRGLA